MYGINRIPADIDPTAEAVAEMEATEMEATETTAWERWVLSSWACCECGERTPNLAIWRSGTPGSGVNCERHWLDYSAARLRLERSTLTVETALAAYEALDRAEAARPKRCAVCRSSAAEWNDGAGRDLCGRHWNQY